MDFSIGEFSAITGLSVYTLRYYEKEKLIIPARKNNGRRCYSDRDLNWVQFIKRLKDTNMPIKEIQKYAVLRANGDSTFLDRMKMLKNHRAVLQKAIAEYQEHLGHLNDKIAFYQEAINKQAMDREL